MNCIKNIVLEKIVRATTEKLLEGVDNISNKTKQKGVPVQKNNTNANSSLLISSRRCQNDIITDIKQQHKIVDNVGDGTNDHSVVVIDDGDEHDHRDDGETGAFLLDIEDDIHYHRALKSRNGDDKREYDYFGLDVQTNTIGGLPYVVDRNRLIVDVGTESNKVFVIKDPDVWVWLFIRCPLSKLRVCKENGEHTLAFMQYKHIVKSLRLLDRAQRTATENGKKLTKKIQKYKLLLESNNHDRATTTVQSSNILAMAGNKTALLEKRVKQLEARAQSSINITVRRRALTSTDNTMFNYLRHFLLKSGEQT